MIKGKSHVLCHIQLHQFHLSWPTLSVGGRPTEALIVHELGHTGLVSTHGAASLLGPQLYGPESGVLSVKHHQRLAAGSWKAQSKIKPLCWEYHRAARFRESAGVCPVCCMNTIATRCMKTTLYCSPGWRIRARCWREYHNADQTARQRESILWCKPPCKHVSAETTQASWDNGPRAASGLHRRETQIFLFLFCFIRAAQISLLITDFDTMKSLVAVDECWFIAMT